MSLYVDILVSLNKLFRLMAYQPYWVIQYQIHPSRRTDVVLINP